MIAYTWEGTAQGATACGVSDDKDLARRAAETWLEKNPAGVVRMSEATLSNLETALTPKWHPEGGFLVSQRQPGGVTWRSAPVAGQDAT